MVDGSESATQAESLTVAPDVPLTVKTTKLATAKLNVSYSKTLATREGPPPIPGRLGGFAADRPHPRNRGSYRRPHGHG